MIEENIVNALKEKIKELTGKDYKIKLYDPPTVELEDYSTNIAFQLARELRKPPMVIAEEIAKSLSIEGVEKIEAVNGYINFFINYKDFSNETTKEIIEKNEYYGKGEKKNIKVILEHTSANPNGPLHIGHGRNAIIGDSLKRVLEFAGYNVETHYYVNDMGRQMAIVVFGIDKFGLNDKKPDHAIAEVYIEANKYLEEHPEEEEKILNLMKEYEDACEKNIENEITEKFKNAVNYALKGIKETLKNINITHDTFIWESSYIRNGMVKEIIENLMKTGKVVKEDVYKLDLSDFGIEKKLVLARANGTSLYSTRDIAYHVDKMENCDIAIDILGADHKLTAEMVKGALKLLGYDVPEVVFYEFISLPEGSMSTRRGRFISVDELFEEAKRRALEEVKKRGIAENEEEMEKIATIIAIGAVRYNIVRISPEKSMVFKWEDAHDFEKVGCPVIQYAQARCCRILEKVEVGDIEGDLFNYELDNSEKILIKTLSKFPKIVEKSAESRKPHIIANYALEVAQAFNKFYGNCPILKEEDVVKKSSRIKIVEATKIVIENALGLLGIGCPGKM